VLCPVSDEALQCNTTVNAETQSADVVLSTTGEPPHLLWSFSNTEEVHGFEVESRLSAPTAFARSFPAKWAGTNASFFHVDGGRSMPGSYTADQTVRVLFSQPVQARHLQLIPGDLVGVANVSEAASNDEFVATLLPVYASPLLRRCQSTSPGPLTNTGKCLALKCKASCYKSLGCEESGWRTNCSAERSLLDHCDVDCSRAAPAVAHVRLVVAVAAWLAVASATGA
jgi:hypothetical protein